MGWQKHVDEGIRNALTKEPISNYWVAVHSKEQAEWGYEKAREIIMEFELSQDISMLDQLHFRVILSDDEKERFPVGTLINF